MTIPRLSNVSVQLFFLKISSPEPNISDSTSPPGGTRAIQTLPNLNKKKVKSPRWDSSKLRTVSSPLGGDSRYSNFLKIEIKNKSSPPGGTCQNYRQRVSDSSARNGPTSSGRAPAIKLASARSLGSHHQHLRSRLAIILICILNFLFKKKKIL